MQVVAVLPDGKEYFAEYDCKDREAFTEVAEMAVRNAKLTTNRKNPEKVLVKVFTNKAVAGVMHRQLAGSISVMPSLERMTKAEFDEEMDEILRQIPTEFRNFVSVHSWDDGHSSGLEEVVNIARELVDSLKPCIKAYKKS